jgi:hypothetical protein
MNINARVSSDPGIVIVKMFTVSSVFSADMPHPSAAGFW